MHYQSNFLKENLILHFPFSLFYKPAITEPPIVKNINSSRPRFSFCPSGKINCEPLYNSVYQNHHFFQSNIHTGFNIFGSKFKYGDKELVPGVE
jgi:hypothetical protein